MLTYISYKNKIISFIFTAAGVFAWGFNFFSSVPWYLRKRLSAWEIFRLSTGMFQINKELNKHKNLLYSWFYIFSSITVHKNRTVESGYDEVQSSRVKTFPTLRCINYTLYKYHTFWLVNSRCIFIFRINFVHFTAAGVFAWGFNFFSSVPWYDEVQSSRVKTFPTLRC
jgi:N6-adenosine-specific RNA methylase IME4